MSNINRDYLIVLNPKTSKVTVPELNYYIYDKYTANLFVNLVTVENGKVVNMVDADQYKLVLHVLKPTNEIQTVENIQVFNKEKALFQIELDQELTKNIGRYKCELLTVDRTDHIVQSAKFSYRVKKSIYNDLDVVTETPQYPIIITLLDKLQDIDKYEEERRANEVARVAAEKARVKDYTDLRQTVTTDIDTMQEKIDSFDGKVQEVDSAVQQMRTNITNYQTEKNKELDSYKTQKDTQINTSIKNMETTINTYKTEKDTQINDKITQQDTKIDKAIALQNKNIQASTKALNDKIDAAVQDQNDTIAANNQAQNKVISDAVAAQNKTINTVVQSDKVQNDRLDTLETSDTNNKAEIKKLQDKDVEHEERITAIEAVNVEQNNRLDAIEIKNDQQDSRLNDVEAKNKKQDLDLKCLFAESHSERITLDDEVGNSVFLQNSKQGFATVDELKGNTLVNCNKDTDKELILNGNIDTSGYGTVTTTEGVDGGKVDVALEGNTMVNVCEQEDPIAITKNYEVTTGNHVALQGEYDGKCRPALNGNTLVNIITSFKAVTGSNADKFDYLTGSYKDIGDGTSRNLSYNVVAKPNTLYTVLANIKTNTLDNKFGLIGWGVTKNNTQVTVPTGFTGQFISTFTTTNEKLTNQWWTDIWKENTTGTIELDGFMILQGDYTNKPIPDYFTVLQSSFEDKLITDEKDANNGKYKVDYKVTGKNKLDQCKGVMNTSLNSKTICIKVNPNTTYAYSSSDYKGKVIIYELPYKVNNGSDLNEVTSIVLNTNIIVDSQTFTTGGATKYILMNYDSASNVQLEEGTTATTYEPYKEYTKTFYLNSPLLKGDTIEDVNGKATHVHRYGKVVLDGSSDENWIDNADEGDTINGHSIYTHINIYSSGECMCDKLPVYNSSKEVENLTNFVILYNNGTVVVNVKGASDIGKVKSWLQSNPITLISKLKTPRYETISNDSILCDSYVNGHLDVDSIIPIDKVEFLKSYMNLKYIYPSTDYIMQFESDNVGILNNIKITKTNVLSSSVDIIKGINKINFTTSNNNSSWMELRGIGFNASKVVVTPKVEQSFGYFKGMKSVGECEDLEIVSNNNDNTLSNKQTITHEPLRGLPNGVKDKYVIIDGKWYIERNCIQLIMDSEFIQNKTLHHYVSQDYPDVVGFATPNKWFKWNSSLICSNLAYDGYRNISAGRLISNQEKIFVNDCIFITLNKNKVNTLNENGFREYLKNNPIVLVGQNTTPTYEPIDYNPFEVYSATTHISNNSNIPCNMVIRNSGFNCILKPNTTYTVSSNNGLSSVVTKASVGDGILRFYDKDTTSVTKMNKVLVLEGDYITGNPPIPAFFKGIESTFEQELVTDEQDKNYGKYKVNVKATNPDNKQENNITFYIKEPLRGVGDIKDKVYVKEDKVVVERNCASVTVDGSDDEIINLNADRDNLIEFIISETSIPNHVGVIYVATTLPNVEGLVEKIVCGYQVIYMQLYKIKLQSNDVAGFRQWLQANPTTVVYQLAEPTYEEVEYFDLKLFVEIFKDTTIIYNSNIPVTSTINYTYSTPLTDAVNTVSDISDQQDSMIIDMATQVATMEMMLM